jgi:hypothetical protein
MRTPPARTVMATPQQYHATFEFNPDARAVLDDLIERFGGPSFAPGQPDVTAFKCGQKSVIEHIVSTLAKAEPLPQRT